MHLEPLRLLLRRGLAPEELTGQATLLIAQALDADWAGLFTAFPGTHTYQVIHHRPDLPTALLAYLDQRTRSITPLARTALGTTEPTFVSSYPDHPDAQQGAVLFGVSAVAHLPLGQRAGQTYVATVMRVASPPSLTRRFPWTEDERTFMSTAAREVQAVVTRPDSPDVPDLVT